MCIRLKYKDIFIIFSLKIKPMKIGNLNTSVLSDPAPLKGHHFSTYHPHEPIHTIQGQVLLITQNTSTLPSISSTQSP